MGKNVWVDESEVERWKALYDQGKTYKEIAKLVGRGRSTITRYLSEKDKNGKNYNPQSVKASEGIELDAANTVRRLFGE